MDKLKTCDICDEEFEKLIYCETCFLMMCEKCFEEHDK